MGLNLHNVLIEDPFPESKEAETGSQYLILVWRDPKASRPAVSFIPYIEPLKPLLEVEKPKWDDIFEVHVFNHRVVDPETFRIIKEEDFNGQLPSYIDDPSKIETWGTENAETIFY